MLITTICNIQQCETVDKNRVLNHSLNHPAYLMASEPKLALRNSLKTSDQIFPYILQRVTSPKFLTPIIFELSSFHLQQITGNLKQKCNNADNICMPLPNSVHLTLEMRWRVKADEYKIESK